MDNKTKTNINSLLLLLFFYLNAMTDLDHANRRIYVP